MFNIFFFLFFILKKKFELLFKINLNKLFHSSTETILDERHHRYHGTTCACIVAHRFSEYTKTTIDNTEIMAISIQTAGTPNASAFSM